VPYYKLVFGIFLLSDNIVGSTCSHTKTKRPNLIHVLVHNKEKQFHKLKWFRYYKQPSFNSLKIRTLSDDTLVIAVKYHSNYSEDSADRMYLSNRYQDLISIDKVHSDNLLFTFWYRELV